MSRPILGLNPVLIIFGTWRVHSPKEKFRYFLKNDKNRDTQARFLALTAFATEKIHIITDDNRR